MRFFAEDLLQRRSLSLHHAEQRADYVRNAVIYVDRDAQFLRGDKSDAELTAFISSSYGFASRQGIRTERDHFGYLAAAGLLGAEFVADPQFYHGLAARGAFQSMPPAAPVIAQFAKGHLAKIRVDLARGRNASAMFALIYRDQAGWTEARVLQIAQQLWPKVLADLPQDVLLHKLRASHAAIRPYGLSASDEVLYICLSFATGFNFGSDLRYPRVQKALAKGAAEEDGGRLAIWDALRSAFEHQLRFL